MSRVRLTGKPCILGIDPGLSGAIAFYAGRSELRINDVLTFDATRGRQVDVYKVVSEFREAVNHYSIQHAFIEQVSAMPKQGVSSMFKFGTVYGTLQGIVASFGIPTTFVTPQKWKKSLSVPAVKDAARLRASQLMPQHIDWWPRKKDHNRADAALIAYYGASKLKGW